MSSLTTRIEKAARQARDVARRRRLESGESGWGTPVLPPPVLPAKPGQPRRVAVVGAGRQGQILAAAVTSITGAELVGLADLDADRLSSTGSTLGLDPAQLHHDAADLFGSTPVDLAVIATTAPSHVALGRVATAAGIRRVLIEKPIDNSYEAAATFVTECEADGTALSVNYSRRWQPDFHGIVAAVAAGQIGTVRIITAQTGAGELAMLASHHVDLCRMLLGAEPVDVSAQLRPTSGVNQRGAEYDDPTGNLTVRFSTGARAFIDVGEGPRTDSVVTIRGDHGLIVIEESREQWLLRAESGRTWTFPFASQFRPKVIASRVIAGVLAEEVPSCSGADGLAALEVVLAALHSSADGARTVSLPLTDDQRAIATRFA